MKINKQQLIDMKACEGGLDRFIEQTDNTYDDIEVESLIGGKNTTDDLLWLTGKTLSKDKIVRFACDCALLNVDLIKPYTDDYDVIIAFLKWPAAANAVPAARAAHAAYTARAAHASTTTVHTARAAHASHAEHASTAAAYASRAARSGRAEAEVEALLIKLFSQNGSAL